MALVSEKRLKSDTRIPEFAVKLGITSWVKWRKSKLRQALRRAKLQQHAEELNDRSRRRIAKVRHARRIRFETIAESRKPRPEVIKPEFV